MNILSKFQLPSTYGLGVVMFLGLEEKGDSMNELINEEGRWECYSKYTEPNCFSFSFSMQCTNRYHLAMVAFSDCQEAMVAR